MVNQNLPHKSAITTGESWQLIHEQQSAYLESKEIIFS